MIDDKDPILQNIEWGIHHEWIWNGLVCHWRHVGQIEGQALLLIHGFGTGCGHWRRNAEEFAKEGWSVFGLDLIGFGASSQPGAIKLDNRLWARQVRGFIEEIIGGPAVLIGHSLGGLVALSCSVFFPSAVKAVIAAPLPDPSLIMDKEKYLRKNRKPPWKRQTKQLIVKFSCKILPLRILLPILTQAKLLEIAIQAAYASSIKGDRDLRSIIQRTAKRKSAIRSLRAMSEAMALRPQKATAPSLLQRLTHPMLLIWGEDDQIVPLNVAWKCQSYLRGLPITTISNSGHCPHDEQPMIFNQVVMNWLGDLSKYRMGELPGG